MFHPTQREEGQTVSFLISKNKESKNKESKKEESKKEESKKEESNNKENINKENINKENKNKENINKENKNKESNSIVNTPKREALLLSPSAFIQIGASPSSSRYSSIRKLEFGIVEEKRNFESTRKLNFFK